VEESSLAEIEKSEPEEGKVSVKKRKRKAKAKDSGILFFVIFPECEGTEFCDRL
jgi:hypothetical protein